MDYQEVHDEYDMLKGNINRMFLTDEVVELVNMYEYAQMRLDKIYEYHYERLNND